MSRLFCTAFPVAWWVLIKRLSFYYYPQCKKDSRVAVNRQCTELAAWFRCMAVQLCLYLCAVLLCSPLACYITVLFTEAAACSLNSGRHTWRRQLLHKQCPCKDEETVSVKWCSVARIIKQAMYQRNYTYCIFADYHTDIMALPGVHNVHHDPLL